MTLLATAKRQAGGAWQSLGFTLAYPWSSWAVVAVALCILPSVAVMGEVRVRALGGDGR